MHKTVNIFVCQHGHTIYFKLELHRKNNFKYVRIKKQKYNNINIQIHASKNTFLQEKKHVARIDYGILSNTLKIM